MKTYTASLPTNRQIQMVRGEKLIPAMTVSVQLTLVLLTALASAAAIVMLSIWAAGSEIDHLIGAGAWGVGFIFLAMAVDNREPKALLQLITGLILIVLAGLQAFVSPDFIIASGFVLATWVAASLFRQLR